MRSNNNYYDSSNSSTDNTIANSLTEKGKGDPSSATEIGVCV